MGSSVDEIGGLARGRVDEIYRELEGTDVPFYEWAILDRELRRVERVLGGGLRLPTRRSRASQERIHSRGAALPTTNPSLG